MKRTIITLAALIGAIPAAFGADFFSTAAPDQLFTFGVRAGVNTANSTLADSAFPSLYHHESWGTGFDIGGTVSLNIRDYISVQPGIFFGRRSGGYTLMGLPGDATAGSVAFAGKRSSYDITVPVVAVVRFNVTDDVAWQLEAGPYLSFTLSSSLDDQCRLSTAEVLYPRKEKGFGWGVKMGTSFRIRSHWYAGVHYLAGIGSPWKTEKTSDGLVKEFGGLRKGWMFTLGYDF